MQPLDKMILLFVGFLSLTNKFFFLKTLVAQNKMSDKIVVVPGKVEDVEIPEAVDTIISEPMGYMLFNERMLETFLHAKKWLKPGGRHTM